MWKKILKKIIGKIMILKKIIEKIMPLEEMMLEKMFEDPNMRVSRKKCNRFSGHAACINDGTTVNCTFHIKWPALYFHTCS